MSITNFTSFYISSFSDFLLMLSIEPSKNALAAIRYFRENLAQQDYYFEKAQVVGKWHGKMAGRLGLSGEVHASDFEALLLNRFPNSVSRLTARNSANRRPMYDCTFSACKSVSVVYGITGDEAILLAHQAGVRAAMAEVERDIQTQVGQGKAKHYVGTGNLIYAEFVHDTSRPLEKVVDGGVKKMIPDPQLHSHCTVINATWFADEGRFRAVEMGNIKALGAYYEAIYHGVMAQELIRSGYELERIGKRWELRGLSRETIEKYSGRTLEIEAVAKERGILSAKAKARLGRLTRNDKNSDVNDSELERLWKSRLSDSEYRTIMASKEDGSGDGAGSAAVALGQKMTPERAVDLALSHHLERRSAVPEKKVLAMAIDLCSGVIHPDEVKQQLALRPEIIRADRRTVTYLSTAPMLAQEQLLLERAAQGRATRPALNLDYQIKNDILNAGQREAIDHVLHSQDRVIMLSGDAGVGKTTLLQEVRNGIHANGKRLFAFAPSADAARDVLRSKGFENADTIAKLLNDEQLQKQLANNVILVDEAGLVGVETGNRLMDITEKQNARLILSGDWKQHSSVEAGDAMRLLETRSGLPVARVKDIVRQRNAAQYKEVVSDVANAIGTQNDPDSRQEKMLHAFDHMNEAGNVVEITERDKRHERIAKDFCRIRQQEEQSVMVVSPTHREAKDITGQIRQELRQQGTITGRERPFERLRSRHYTQSEKQLPDNYTRDEVIEFHRNALGFKAGQRYRINHVNEKGQVMVSDPTSKVVLPLRLQEAERFDIYRKEQLELAKGDRLRVTKNLRSLDGSSLLNGQSYDIKGFDENGHIKLSNGQVLHKNAQHFNHGYCSTSHASQGKDADHVLLAQSSMSLAAANDKQFYVSISRGVESCTVYTDDKQALRQAVSRSGDRISATEVAELAAKQKTQQRQKREHVKVMNQYGQQTTMVNQNEHEQQRQRQSPRRMGRPGHGR